MTLATVNYIAVILAAIAGFIVGAVWYSVLFAKPWMAATGVTEAEIEARRAAGTAPSIVPLLGGSIVGNLIMAFVLSVVLHSMMGSLTMGSALLAAFLIWLGFVVTVMAVNNAFEMRKAMLTVINGAHWLVVLLVMGVVIAAFG
jgi:hypothetical protein